jgi:hypothetical protein
MSPAEVQGAGTAGLRGGYDRSWAVVIGIDRYRHWPGLSYAVNDADRVAARLRAIGFDPIISLRDDEATAEGITEVWRRLAAQTAADDRVLFFFAGHGQTDAGPDGEQVGYLIPVDGHMQDYDRTALSMAGLRRMSRDVPAKHILFVIDACYSGLMLLRAGRQGVLPAWLSKPVRQVLAAGRAGDRVAEEGGHGIFTRLFLEALDGYGDVDGDGIITASEVGVYVNPRVAALSQGSQTPQFGRFAGDGEFVLLLDAGARTRPLAPAAPLTLAPVVTPVHPRHENVEVPVGQTLGFAIDLLHPDSAESATATWYVDEKVVGYGPRWNFTPEHAARYAVRVVARDRGGHEDGARWAVTAIPPERRVPRVAIHVPDDVPGQPRACGVLCGELERAFLDRRVPLVSQEQLQEVRDRDAALAMEDEATATVLAHRLGFDVLVVGRCRATPPRRQPYGGVDFFVADADCEVRAVETATARITMIRHLDKPRADTSAVSPEAAMARALHATTRGRADDIAARIIEDWGSLAPRRFEVLVQQVAPEEISGVELVLGKIAGMQHLRRMGYQQGLAEFTLEFGGDPQALINELAHAGYELVAEDPGRIGVRRRNTTARTRTSQRQPDTGEAGGAPGR